MKYYISSGDLNNFETNAENPLIAIKEAINKGNPNHLSMIMIVAQTTDINSRLYLDTTLYYSTISILKELGFNEKRKDN